MSETVRRTVFAAYAASALAALWTVAATRFGGRDALLARMTAEGGLFETATALVLALLGGWAISRGTRTWRIGGIVLVLAALEELSWGQHLLGFETPAWLTGRNLQGEANLHNLVDSEIFSALLLVPIHLGLVVVPLALALWPGLGGRLASLPTGMVPTPHNTLIFCFGWGLHAWGVPAAMADSLALIGVLALAGLACLRAPAWRVPGVAVHWAIVCAATVVFAASADVYRYYNMQYEIRELFVALGLAAWLTGWAGTRPAARSGSHPTGSS